MAPVARSAVARTRSRPQLRAQRLQEIVIPNGLRIGAPSFAGWITTAPTTAGTIASLAATVSGAQRYRVTAYNLLETVALRWLRELLGLEPRFPGSICERRGGRKPGGAGRGAATRVRAARRRPSTGRNARDASLEALRQQRGPSYRFPRSGHPRHRSPKRLADSSRRGDADRPRSARGGTRSRCGRETRSDRPRRQRGHYQHRRWGSRSIRWSPSHAGARSGCMSMARTDFSASSIRASPRFSTALNKPTRSSLILTSGWPHLLARPRCLCGIPRCKSAPYSPWNRPTMQRGNGRG